MHKTRVTDGINVCAILAVIVYTIAPGEIDLEHGTQTLNNRRRTAPPKYLPQARDRGIANRVQLRVGSRYGKQVQVCGNHLHRQPMPVEGSIVQHHVVAPAQAIENRPRTGDRSYRKTLAQRFAEGAEIRLNFEILLTPSGRVAKTGDDFIKDQQHAILTRQLAQPFEVSFTRQ